ncbi:hypothetical protein KK120_11175 [Virgibacillus dakarensis]|nr:hypothetical protein [Virgibacillus dakarensis]
MDPIAVQTYTVVEREVNSVEKKERKQENKMYLYQDRIVTAKNEFPVHQVLDVSFRKMGDQGGLLYLHTIKGLYSFMVKSSPNEFIEAFKGY